MLERATVPNLATFLSVSCSYEVKLPSSGARSKFFSQLINAVVSVPRRKSVNKGKQKEALPDLPKAPKVDKGPSEAELQERSEIEENHIRRLRMCLRDVCNRYLLPSPVAFAKLVLLLESWLNVVIILVSLLHHICSKCLVCYQHVCTFPFHFVLSLLTSPRFITRLSR